MRIDRDTAAIVTGGASGLGKSSAEALAAAGAMVTIFDVDAVRGMEVAAAIGGRFVAVDIASEQSVIDGLAAARGAYGQERILIHCAMANRKGRTVGRDRRSGAPSRFSTADFDLATQGILVASYRIASLSALGMAALDPRDDDERGTIILTASIAAQDAQVGQVAYGAAKAGVAGMVLPMARDLMDYGIRVNAILPGLFDTPLLARLPERSFDALAAAVPFPKRLGRPDEFASLALELIRNLYFNGATLRLDGAIRMPPR